MKHLFKFLLIFPCIYFFSWIYITLYALFSLAWILVSVLFFNIVLRNVADIKSWGIWLLLLFIAFASDWLDYICFKKMFRLRRELGKSKAGRH